MPDAGKPERRLCERCEYYFQAHSVQYDRLTRKWLCTRCWQLTPCDVGPETEKGCND